MKALVVDFLFNFPIFKASKKWAQVPNEITKVEAFML
jgi:hypothetical protein